jgi:3-oxoacyl-[acyl-carrier-protein] synthase-1
MSKIYLSHNNIISALGFSTEENTAQIEANVSGVNLIDDKNYFHTPFYGSIINKNQLENEFLKLNTTQNYSALEKAMLLSLNEVISASKIELNSRVGLIISTTKGNIDALKTEHQNEAYLSVLAEKIKSYFGFKTEPIVVSNACVSGLLAVSVAKRYILQKEYDAVFIVSGDLVSEFILSGFNSFQAISPERCKPYDIDRKGINIGEAVASILVTENLENLSEDAVELLGESAINDANHISGPSRTGEGLFKSIKMALKEAELSSKEIDYISAHGTATIFNDAMETEAFNRLDLQNTPLNSYKAYFGHTLGASGLLETIMTMQSLKNNTLYKSLGFDVLGTKKPLKVISKNKKTALTYALKTASGFGGVNTASVFKKVN